LKLSSICKGSFYNAQQLLKAVGGKENISAVSHCATRMRFVLKDPKKADVPVIEDIPSVKGLPPTAFNNCCASL
jgi:phosphotransferase system IIB component